MASEWNESVISDLLANKVLWIEDGNHGENRPRQNEFAQVGVPFIRPDDLKGGRVDFRKCDHIDEVGYARVRKGKGQPGDILFTHRATVGRMARVGNHDPKFVANPGVTVWRVLDPETIDPTFLYFAMQGSHFMDQVWAEAGNTDTFPYVSLTQQRRLWLRYPDIETQRDIAQALGALDDKIALLRETNTTLEAVAQALFKSWFVDFDPVRAKEEERDPEGVPPELADMFPSEFEDSEFGTIPKGWRLGNLGEVVEILDFKRVPLSGAERAKRRGPYPYYGAAALMDHVNDFLFDGTYLLMGEDGSVTNTDGAPILQYVWGKFWVNNHAHVLSGKKAVCTEHIMLSLKGTNISGFVTGAVQAKLNQGNLNRIPFLIPDPEIATIFAEEIQPLYASIRANQEQSTALSDLRDSLLPRLMSGKLRVSQVLV